MKKGATRIVFLVGGYAIKIPHLFNSHKHFLDGCFSNWKERGYYKDFKTHPYGELMSPSLFCSLFGLFQIQRKCKPCLNELSEIDKAKFHVVCEGDTKKENFGWYKGKLVCVDYA